MKTIPTVEKAEWTLKIDGDELAKAVRAIDAKLARMEAVTLKMGLGTPPPYGTPMEAPRGQTGMALGQWSVFCYTHNRVEDKPYWKRADTTK